MARWEIYVLIVRQYLIDDCSSSDITKHFWSKPLNYDVI